MSFYLLLVFKKIVIIKCDKEYGFISKMFKSYCKGKER